MSLSGHDIAFRCHGLFGPSTKSLNFKQSLNHWCDSCHRPCFSHHTAGWEYSPWTRDSWDFRLGGMALVSVFSPSSSQLCFWLPISVTHFHLLPSCSSSSAWVKSFPVALFLCHREPAGGFCIRALAVGPTFPPPSQFLLRVLQVREKISRRAWNFRGV